MIERFRSTEQAKVAQAQLARWIGHAWPIRNPRRFASVGDIGASRRSGGKELHPAVLALDAQIATALADRDLAVRPNGQTGLKSVWASAAVTKLTCFQLLSAFPCLSRQVADRI